MVFYGISINVCPLLPKHIYIYIYMCVYIYIYVCVCVCVCSVEYLTLLVLLDINNLFAQYFYLILIIYLHTVKWFQVFNTNNSIEYHLFICTQLNDYNYCDST